MKILIQLATALVLLSLDTDICSQQETKNQDKSEWWNAGWPKWPDCTGDVT